MLSYLVRLKKDSGWGTVGGRSITLAVLAATLWLAAPLAAHSAGLGRINVLSSLGRPLNAEIELHSQPGEQDIVARLASPEAFSRAGIEINPALLSVRFTVERRNGRQVLRVTTTQPVNEPFLDLLVDLQWNGGRLLREYTVLLDPPEFKGRQAIAAAPAPSPKPAPQPQPALAPVDSKPAPGVEAKPLPPDPAPPILAPTPPSAATTPQEKTEAEKPDAAEKPEAEKPAAEKPAAAPAAAAAGTHEVQKGDTLGTIARQNLPPGVSLNQMLVAIYRANEDAFIRGNVNLMRTGRILEIPDAGSIGTVDRDDASRLVREHHAQFNEYRSRLATVPAPAEAAADQRDDAGRIEPKPEAAPAPAPAQDQVRLSKADPKKPATPGGRAAREDDQVARERELREAQSRVADLEKNVSDLQKLLEMKNQQLAELEKKAGAQAAPPLAAPVPPAAKPAAKASDTPVAKVPEAPNPVPVPAPPATAEASEAPKPPPPAPVAEAPKPAPPPSPVAEAPKPAPPPVAKAPATPAAQTPRPKPKPAAAPQPEPSFFEDPMLLGGLAVVLLGLVGYSAFLWRRRKAAQAKFQDSVLGAAVAGAVAGSAGEPGSPTMQPTASQASVRRAGMEAEEVDPIAEADVYIAYGRDAQAEQILKEALAKDANRTALHAKLLEIYANRKDAKAFEQTALKLKNLTNGAGVEWDKACALGRGIDPRNGLYGSGGEARPAAVTAPATAAAAPTLDFDLGGPSQNPAAVPDISLDETGKRLSSLSGIDIDLGTTVPAAPAAHEKTVTSIDFNLDLGTTKSEAPSAPEPAAAQPSSGLDFDLKLDDMPSAAPEETSAPPVDLGSISLDLGTPSDATMVAPQRSTDPKWQEVATKLDLAKAYEEMGDKNGARELLNEVMKDGDAAQKGQAGQLLAKLG
jgi:pilus assembly protein FimV